MQPILIEEEALMQQSIKVVMRLMQPHTKHSKQNTAHNTFKDMLQ
jgi:hypothetical protein